MRGKAARRDLRERLEARRPELEQATLTRVQLISDSSRVPDPTYAEGLRTAVSDAVAFGLSGIEAPRERPAPPSLLTQARLAARNGVGLETVLRRYFAGYALLNNALIEEAEASGHRAAELKDLLHNEAALFDRLVVVVSEEYRRDAAQAQTKGTRRRVELVQRLLDGELVLDTSDLGYGFEGFCHLGAIAEGERAAESLRDLAARLDCRLLAVPREDGSTWAWLGAREAIVPERLAEALSESWPTAILLALGEPALGLQGWRLTHRQARAALPIATRREGRFARYGEVALLASALQDELLATTLRDLYMAPLEHERDGGATARQTLSAYFAAERQVTSAAVSLGVNRNTVANRLGAIERRIGRPLSVCGAELEAALRLEEFWRSN